MNDAVAIYIASYLYTDSYELLLLLIQTFIALKNYFFTTFSRKSCLLFKERVFNQGKHLNMFLMFPDFRINILK